MNVRANKIAVFLGGGRAGGVVAGSRASVWNYSVWGSGWSIGCRFACEDILKTMHSIIVMALLVRPINMVSLFALRNANTLKRSVKVRVMKMKLQDSILKRS